MSKQPPLPDSFIIEQLIEFLDCVEQTAQESVSKLDEFINEDKDFGYCKATGYAQSRLEWMASRASSFRKIYLTN
jgi:hypothetical protein